MLKSSNPRLSTPRGVRDLPMTFQVELLDVTVVTEVDPEPPLDYLGKYSTEPGEPERTIDRRERGDMLHGEYRYFIAAHSPEETGNPESVEEDYQRMEALNDGEWQMLNLSAQATLRVAGTIQTVDTPPIGGVVSDGPDDHLEEIARERLQNIWRVLDRLGIEWDGTATWDDDAPLSGEISIE